MVQDEVSGTQRKIGCKPHLKKEGTSKKGIGNVSLKSK